MYLIIGTRVDRRVGISKFDLESAHRGEVKLINYSEMSNYNPETRSWEPLLLTDNKQPAAHSDLVIDRFDMIEISAYARQFLVQNLLSNNSLSRVERQMIAFFEGLRYHLTKTGRVANFRIKDKL